MTTPVVDSHLHVWDLERSAYAWLGPGHGELYRSFTPGEAEDVLRTAGISAAVLVQAEDSTTDTELMLEAAENSDVIAGVVGWVRLDDPDTALEQLSRYDDESAFRGVRHLVHDDPRGDFLELEEVRRSLGLLAERGLPFDVPDAWPRHLARLPDLAEAVPELVLVIDHLGKPPLGSAALEDWAAALRSVAARSNTVAKVSGLQVPGRPFTSAELRPVWEVALDCFGPSRLMYGGDWPMTVPQGGYQAHWLPVRALVDELSIDEQAQILSGTAIRTYRLQLGAGDDQ